MDCYARLRGAAALGAGLAILKTSTNSAHAPARKRHLPACALLPGGWRGCWAWRQTILRWNGAGMRQNAVIARAHIHHGGWRGLRSYRATAFLFNIISRGLPAHARNGGRCACRSI